MMAEEPQGEQTQWNTGMTSEDGQADRGSSMAAMMEFFLKDEQKLKNRLAEERRRQDREMEECVLEMQEQMRE